MSYHKHRYGGTNIKNGRIDNLSINWDADAKDLKKCHKSKRYPVLLFTPDMDKTVTHYHIQLKREEARRLRDWLNDFLDDVTEEKHSAEYYVGYGGIDD